MCDVFCSMVGRPPAAPLACPPATPRRGFRVATLDAEANALQAPPRPAGAAVDPAVHMRIAPAPLSGQRLPAGCGDLVTVMHRLHLMDPHATLREAHRLLHRDGYLAVAWNDWWARAPGSSRV